MSTTPEQTFEFPHATVEIYDGWVRTVFKDGTTPLHALPQSTQLYIEHARSLGYQGNNKEVAWAKCRDHELIHTVLGHLLFNGPSPTLKAVAEGGPPHRFWREEEALVLTLQRWLNKKRSKFQ
jgi:hypothetical protein